jgi:import inner membrane translocase subunit TIM44
VLQLAAGKMMEQGPVLIISFTSQQIMLVRNSKGDIVEGDPVGNLLLGLVYKFCEKFKI